MKISHNNDNINNNNNNSNNFFQTSFHSILFNNKYKSLYKVICTWLAIDTLLYTLYIINEMKKKKISVAKKFRVSPLFVSHIEDVICCANNNDNNNDNNNNNNNINNNNDYNVNNNNNNNNNLSSLIFQIQASLCLRITKIQVVE